MDVGFTGTADFGCDPVVSLPISLNSLWAHHDNQQKVNIIDWITESEINNDYFTIESSPDAINLKDIGPVRGAGYSNSRLTYSFNDPFYYPLTHYRLKQTDFNGKFEYFGPVYVKVDDQTGFDIGMAGTNVYPNPSTGIINMKLPEAVCLTISVYDISGSPVFVENSNGQQMVTMDLNQIAKGSYIIHIETQLGVHIQKIILE